MWLLYKIVKGPELLIVLFFRVSFEVLYSGKISLKLEEVSIMVICCLTELIDS